MPQPRIEQGSSAIMDFSMIYWLLRLLLLHWRARTTRASPDIQYRTQLRTQHAMGLARTWATCEDHQKRMPALAARCLQPAFPKSNIWAPTKIHACHRKQGQNLHSILPTENHQKCAIMSTKCLVSRLTLPPPQFKRGASMRWLWFIDCWGCYCYTTRAFEAILSACTYLTSHHSLTQHWYRLGHPTLHKKLIVRCGDCLGSELNKDPQRSWYFWGTKYWLLRVFPLHYQGM